MPMRFDPLRELDRVAQSLGQLLNRPGSVRVTRADDEIRLVVDLPGVKADDIELDVAPDRVEVRAVRRSTAGSPGSEVVHEQRLSDPVEVDRVRAHYEDGVLTVHLPRASGSQPRRVRVETAGDGPTGTPPSGGAAAGTDPGPGGGAGSGAGGGAAGGRPTEPAPPPLGEQANPLPTS